LNLHISPTPNNLSTDSTLQPIISHTFSASNITTNTTITTSPHLTFAMDILELIDDKDQQIAESSQRPFQCPEHDCIKVRWQLFCGWPLRLQPAAVKTSVGARANWLCTIEFQPQV
jgi:hypothetical protein